MSTITKFVSGDARANGKYTMYPKKCAGEPILIENVLDFSSSGPGAVDASAVVAALKIPANTLVLKVGLYVMTAEGGTSTCTIGDDTSATGWDVSNINCNSANTSAMSIEGTDTYGLGKVYTVDDTIDLAFSAHAVDNAKLCVWALICPMGTDVA